MGRRWDGELRRPMALGPNDSRRMCSPGLIISMLTISWSMMRSGKEGQTYLGPFWEFDFEPLLLCDSKRPASRLVLAV